MSATMPMAAPQQGAEFYLWSFPGAAVQVHLYFNVVQGIRERLAAASDTDASVSIQGLLLGKIVTPGLSQITGFLPLYTGNRTELEEAIAFFKKSSEGLLPVGYFRSNTAGSLALSPDDLLLAETHFSDPNHVLLLVQASAEGAANAGFFFWDGGKMNGGFYDFCFLEFPFDVPLLIRGRQRNGKTGPALEDDFGPDQAESVSVESRSLADDVAPVRSATPMAGIDSARQEPPRKLQENPGDSNTNPNTRRLRLAGELALAAVVLAVACFAAGIVITQKLVRIADVARNTEHPPIALKVERQGTDLSVTWNHNSPLVHQAETGLLTINDGDPRKFRLDKNHIRSGSIVYSPITDQVTVQLDLQTPDQRVVSESVRVILNRPGTTKSSAPVKAAEARSQRPFTLGSSASRDAGTNARANTSPAGIRVAATRQFIPPQETAPSQPQTPDLAPPPAVTVITSARAVPAPTLIPALPNSPPPPPKTSSTVNSGINTSHQPPPEHFEPLIPPIPIQQRLPPPLTAVQRSFISRTAVVEIKVFIDASGKVRKTEPLTHANPVLVTAAQSAANLWTFHPARKAGQNVPSKMILRFKFDPPK